MDIQYLYQLIGDNENPLQEDIPLLKEVVTEYPYFQTGLFFYLKALYLYSYEDFESEIKKLSIFVSDRKALYYYIFDSEYSYYFKQTGQKELAGDKTSILLDAFFESKGETVSQELEYDFLSHSGLATTDYLSYLETAGKEKNNQEKDEPAVQLKYQDIIDSFISKTEKDGGIFINIKEEEDVAFSEEEYDEEEESSEESNELNEDVFFTETLAKIYIKQKKYEKAYKIIKHLSLKYPKKNIYFADQLSFLDKLIIITKFKDKK